MNQKNGKSYFQQGTHLRGGSAQAITTDPLRPVRRDKGQANLSILSLAFIGLAGMVHRKKGRHEEN